MRSRFNITLSQSINDELEQYADIHDMTRSAVIETALKDYFHRADNIQMSVKDTQNIFDTNLRPEVDDLNQRMKIIEDQLFLLVPNTITIDPYQSSKETELLKDINEDQIINNNIPLNHKEWIRQKDVVEMMDESMKINTRKAKVSKAVSKGDLITNGKKGSECLIEGSSAIEWIKSL